MVELLLEGGLVGNDGLGEKVLDFGEHGDCNLKISI